MTTNAAWRRLAWAVLAVAVVIAVTPYLWLLLTSFKTRVDILSPQPTWRFAPTWANYPAVFIGKEYLPLLWNSLLIAGFSTLLSLAIGAPAAYVLARERFPGREDLFFFFLTTRMAPPISIAVPLFLFFTATGMIDTLHAVIIAHTSFNLSLVVWMMRGFFADIPREIDEAAQMDGRSRLGAFVGVVLPLAALVYMLFEGFTPLYAGSMGLALTVALILGTAITTGAPSMLIRYIFWIGLALVVAALSRDGLQILPVSCVVVGLILITAFVRGGMAALRACRDALAESAKSAITVGMACAIVGVIIGMMSQTGVGTIFGGWVIGLGEKSLFLALVMTMLLSILLGTGIPTIPTYIITAALAAPALAKLGVPLIASHMFAFYYGIMADLSPPVALAALAAAPIAKENPDKIGWEAMRIALAGYVIPFIFVYSPALMLQAGDPMAAKLGFYGAVALAGLKALVAIGLFGMVAIGFLFTRMTLIERLVALGAAFCLLGEFPFSDTAGFVLAAALALWQWRQRPPRAVEAV